MGFYNFSQTFEKKKLIYLFDLNIFCCHVDVHLNHNSDPFIHFLLRLLTLKKKRAFPSCEGKFFIAKNFWSAQVFSFWNIFTISVSQYMIAVLMATRWRFAKTNRDLQLFTCSLKLNFHRPICNRGLFVIKPNPVQGLFNTWTNTRCLLAWCLSSTLATPRKKTSSVQEN